MKIDSEKINDLANNIDILKFIEQYLEPSGKQGRLVIFHCCNNPDINGSLVVDPERNFYKCYSCGSGTNALAFLCKELHYTFQEACKIICDYTGDDDIEAKQTSDTVKFLRGLQRIKRIEDIQSEDGRVYGNYADYDKFLKKPAELWLKEGIKAETQALYDVRIRPNYNQIVYPIFSSDGRYICPKARSTLNDHDREMLSIPKYKYLGKIGTNSFFTGVRQSEEAIKKSKEIIIFEGLKSCMKAFQYGYKNTVAAETACLNKDQINLLLKYGVRNVTIAFDKDKTYNDAIKNCDMLKHFVNLYVVMDDKNLLPAKNSPVDVSKDIWETLYMNKRRVN